METELSQVCATCGLTLGSHRADGICYNQCPAHEGRMDWPKTRITMFKPSIKYESVPFGTPSKVI